jgi:multicomponent Na+:H+ antiporter subunit B
MASCKIVPIEGAADLYHYIIANFQADTGSVNAVTGIYLDYRVFDTLFETLLLLVSVIGIIYFSRHEGDY